MAAADDKATSVTKDKKAKKRSETGGVRKVKKDKKKDKKERDKLARAVDVHLTEKEAKKAAKKKKKEKEKKTKKKTAASDNESNADEDDAKAVLDPDSIVMTSENLVPFALPLGDEKLHAKVYKLIKRSAKLRAIHRGVKEVEKAIKKSGIPPGRIYDVNPQTTPGLVIIAGDISPMEVIMHFPILCEEFGVPYLFVRSRADLGTAACTKRATSVVMLRREVRDRKKESKNDKKEGEEEDQMDEEEVQKRVEQYQKAWHEVVDTAKEQWEMQCEPWANQTHALQVAARAMTSA